jgi:hypothetical protein
VSILATHNVTPQTLHIHTCTVTFFPPNENQSHTPQVNSKAINHLFFIYTSTQSTSTATSIIAHDPNAIHIHSHILTAASAFFSSTSTATAIIAHDPNAIHIHSHILTAASAFFSSALHLFQKACPCHRASGASHNTPATDPCNSTIPPPLAR